MVTFGERILSGEKSSFLGKVIACRKKGSFLGKEGSILVKDK
jgi:hypothetical protein